MFKILFVMQECLPKLRIKLVNISCQNTIPCFLIYCSSDQSILSFTFSYYIYVAMATCEPYLYSLVPSVPRSLRIVSANTTSVTISWMPPEPPNGIITRYDLQYKRMGQSYTSVNPQTTELSRTITGLVRNTEYECRVRASTSVGDGPYTANFMFRTGKVYYV